MQRRPAPVMPLPLLAAQLAPTQPADAPQGMADLLAVHGGDGRRGHAQGLGEHVVKDSPEAKTAPTEFNVVLHGETYHVRVTGAGHKELSERHFYFTVDGVPEEVVVETLDEIVLEGGAHGAVKKAIGGKRPRATKEGHVTTSMPGNIVDVLVKEGDSVTAGQAVLVTEAMKMETELLAPIGGKVTGVFVEKGDSVNPDEVLIEIEPA